MGRHRHQLHAVLDEGTTAMDDIFPLGDSEIVTQSAHKIATAVAGRLGEHGA